MLLRALCGQLFYRATRERCAVRGVWPGKVPRVRPADRIQHAAMRRTTGLEAVWPTGVARQRDLVAKIRPLLAGIANSAIASALGVSLYYAADIRRGRRRPHPRHWQALAKLVGLSLDI